MPKSKEQKREYQRQYRARRRREMEYFLTRVMAGLNQANEDATAYSEWLSEKKEYLQIGHDIIEKAVSKSEATLDPMDVAEARAHASYWRDFYLRFEALMKADERVQRYVAKNRISSKG